MIEKCVNCQREIEGSNVFGQLHSPLCLACWNETQTKPTIFECAVLNRALVVISGPRHGAILPSKILLSPHHHELCECDKCVGFPREYKRREWGRS